MSCGGQGDERHKQGVGGRGPLAKDLYGECFSTRSSSQTDVVQREHKCSMLNCVGSWQTVGNSVGRC